MNLRYFPQKSTNFFFNLFLIPIYFLNLPGLVLLFATGTQIYWTIHELHAVDVIDSLTTEKYTFDDNLAKIFCWYIGAILGGLLGAILLPRILKRTIYVSKTLLKRMLPYIRCFTMGATFTAILLTLN